MLAIKDMTKMASHESSESSKKSSIPDKVNMTAQSKMDEKKSSTASSSVKQHDELSDTAADTKENNLTSDATDEHTSLQKNDSDNLKSEDKDNLKLLVIEKDNSKIDNKQETQNVASLADQNTDEEREIKSEDNKDSLTKGGSVSKRKRKTVRLVQRLHRKIT